MPKRERTPSEKAKHSQSKGRRGEHELRKILQASGYKARTLGMYEPHDVYVLVRDALRHIEVKRQAHGMSFAYKAFAKGDYAVCFRADNNEWLIIQRLGEYLQEHAPNSKQEAVNTSTSARDMLENCDSLGDL